MHMLKKVIIGSDEPWWERGLSTSTCATTAALEA